MTTTVSVGLQDRGYDIHIGDGLLADCGALIAEFLERPRTVIVTDETLAALHLAPLCAALDKAAISHQAIILPAGEQTKSFAVLEQVISELLDRKVERGDVLVALGGGVIGDLAGFAASVLRRGIDFIQIPTSLLAQVDSSVGGKTGINTRHGKNLVGRFHQPRLVIADTAVLSTLPRRQLLTGYAEVVKYGMLGDAELFAWLEANGRRLIDGDAAARAHAVAVSCTTKAAIVAADEHEHGQRALLNLGHTFGHALEAEAGYGERLMHGEAVAIGMVMAARLSARIGYCDDSVVIRLVRHLESVGLATDPAGADLAETPADLLLRHMYQDKKVIDGRIALILLTAIGQSFVTRKVGDQQILGLLETINGVAPAGSGGRG